MPAYPPSATNVSLTSGSVGAPSLNIIGDSNTGLYSSGADIISFAAGGIRRFEVLSSSLFTYGSINVGTTGAFDLGSSSGRFRSAFLLPVAGAGMKVGGLLTIPTTTTGNVGSGEDDLLSYSIPANLLAANGDSVMFEAAGSITNNTNAKRLRARFGASVILDTGAAGIQVSTSIQWVIRGRIIRTGAATQKCLATLTTSSTLFSASYSTAAETLSGSLVLKVTGEAVSDNDIAQELMAVSFVPAP